MRTSIVTISLVSCTALAAGASLHDRYYGLQKNATGGIEPYEIKKGPLDTDWTSKVGTNPWPEYPRPLLQRSEWKSLNGVWQYQNASGPEAVTQPPFGVQLQQSALVPFCLESAISGIMGDNLISNWYRTTFDVPLLWTTGNRVILNFGAVDYQATVFVNGQKVGDHTGGYWAFSFDVTDHLNANGDNELLVFAFDPTDSGNWQIPIGKQTLQPSHIFYTPCSGIWQSVWIESAPASHITQLDISADMHGKVNITVHSSSNGSTPVEVTIHEPHSTDVKATASGTSGGAFQFTVDSAELWSPDSPTLYNLTVKLGSDTVQSYTGFRTISRGVVDGVQRPLLNGEFIFQFGTLDQGFWPDGIYTPPTAEAMIYDLRTLKKIGYNMVRKHIKVENPLWFKACDELGLLVFQDMPSLRTSVPNPASTKPAQCVEYVPVGFPNATEEFGRQLEILIQQHKSYPSIVSWVIYNEGWGQPNQPPWAEFGFTDLIRNLDPTRLIDSVTGWHDHGAGDFHDNHHYANPQCGTPFYSTLSTPYDPSRIGLQGEFGGIGQNLSINHLWNVPNAIRDINQTYELDADIKSWNYRAHVLLRELTEQTERYACSGAIWTQTTDVEGEVNGMLSYDRRILRPDLAQWNADIKALYAAAAARGGSNSSMLMMPRAVGVDGDGSVRRMMYTT